MWNPPPPVPEAPPPPADLRSYARPLPPPEPVAPNHPPAWLVTIGVAVAIIIVGGGFFYWLGNRHTSTETATPVQLESPSATAAAAAGGEHPYKKHLELVGYRIFEDSARKPQLKFLIVNHSSTELAPVNMRVTVETTKSNAGDPPVAVLQFTTPKLAAYGSQEMTAPLNTKLRAYEIPDWQFLRLQPEITSK